MKTLIIRILMIVIAIGIFPMACNRQNDIWKEILIDDESWHKIGFLFPIKITLWGELERDTICIVTTTQSLWYSMNIRVADELFSLQLYNTIKETGGYLPVKKQLFDELKENEVKSIPEVDSIYNKLGIDGVLQHFLSSTGKLVSKPEIEDYIVFLCFQHGMYFRFLDAEEGPIVFLDKGFNF